MDDPLVAVDLRCRVRAFNRAAEEITGFRAPDVLDRPCTDIFARPRCGPICKAQSALQGGEKHYDVHIKRRLGPPVAATVTTAPLFDETGAVVGALETIRLCEKNQVDQRLQREHVHRRAILDSLADGVITVDRDWRISSFNAAAAGVLGYRAEDVLGKFCSRVLRTERCTNGCPLARSLEDGAQVNDRHVSLSRADGDIVEVSLNTAVLRSEDGEALGGVLSFRPIPAAPRPDQAAARGTRFMGLIGNSPAMRRMFRLIQEVADSDATVLVTGESGTGKELVAAALQQLSPRRRGPYVKVSCAVFSEALLESELFGHVRGAFTDAVSERRGRFELADRGTLFLDEIGDISPRIQVKLLRVLQEREFERVGAETSTRVDVRLIAATHRDLPAMMARGSFREDLFYRLNVIPVHVPPLRQRRADIPLLVQHFLRVYAAKLGKDVTGVDQRTLDLLLAYPWPGNVRQLENAVEQATVRARACTVTEDLLPDEVRFGSDATAALGVTSEVQRITAALDRHRWHHEQAARELGISRTTLWRRMRRLGLQFPRG